MKGMRLAISPEMKAMSRDRRSATPSLIDYIDPSQGKGSYRSFMIDSGLTRVFDGHRAKLVECGVGAEGPGTTDLSGLGAAAPCQLAP